MLNRWTLLAGCLALGSLLCVSAAFASGRTTERTACPTEVLWRSVPNLPTVLTAAHQLLAKQTLEVQGRSYRLTPKYARIVLVESLDGGESPVYRQTPGLQTLYRLAEKACGARTAQVTWAINYTFPTVIAGESAHVFFTRTRHGWVFWGDWCGAGQSSSWRHKYCP
jgi:hypothetical protein